MFSLNSIGCVTKCGPAGILEGSQPADVCKANVLKSSLERFEAYFLIDEGKRMERQNGIKNNLLMIPPWI